MSGRKEKKMAANKKYQRNDLVWVKIANYPNWPAMVCFFVFFVLFFLCFVFPPSFFFFFFFLIFFSEKKRLWNQKMCQRS